MNPLLGILFLSSLFLVVFAIGELAYHVFKVDAEYTRKWSHLMSGFLALLFPVVLKDVLWVGIICALFIVVLFLSRPLKLLKSINAVKRDTYGSILFPIAVFISFVAYHLYDENVLFYYLPILTLAISDLAAALVGKRYPIRKIKTFQESKSLGGSLAFTATAWILFISAFFLNTQLSLAAALVLPPCLAVIELYSPKGFDNVSIPLGTVIGLALFICM